LKIDSIIEAGTAIELGQFVLCNLVLSRPIYIYAQLKQVILGHFQYCGWGYIAAGAARYWMKIATHLQRLDARATPKTSRCA
jgi:hypothetical protein